MLGDLELGVMTEFANRVGESLKGMGLFGEAFNFDKAFGAESCCNGRR